MRLFLIYFDVNCKMNSSCGSAARENLCIITKTVSTAGDDVKKFLFQNWSCSDFVSLRNMWNLHGPKLMSILQVSLPGAIEGVYSEYLKHCQQRWFLAAAHVRCQGPNHSVICFVEAMCSLLSTVFYCIICAHQVVTLVQTLGTSMLEAVVVRHPVSPWNFSASDHPRLTGS